MARAFVAVVPPQPVLDAIADAVDGLRARCPSKARWAPREQWHLTLRFLGDHVDLDAAAAQLGAVAFAPFELQLGGVGAFPRPSRANVLWIGAAVGCTPLTTLAAAVNDATASLTPLDDKPFRAHLTVARFDRAANLRDVVHRPNCEPVGAPWRVDEIVLVESVLGRGPAQHRVHARVAAAGR